MATLNDLINLLKAFYAVFKEEPLGVLGGLFILYIAFWPRSGYVKYRRKRQPKTQMSYPSHK